jgi:hypothetical protein
MIAIGYRCQRPVSIQPGFGRGIANRLKNRESAKATVTEFLPT